MYDNNLCVEKNLHSSAQWYMKAAEMGFKVAQFNLGLCYQKGEGVVKDLNEAIKWFRKSAEQGYPDAEAKMGYFTATGKGIRQDLPQALKWYRLAAGLGDVASYADIGRYHAEGYGVQEKGTAPPSITSWEGKRATLMPGICPEGLITGDSGSNPTGNSPFTG